MKKQLFNFILVGVVYLIVTMIYSYFFGLPPFYDGITIGFPAIYYKFYISETDFQHGTIGINLFYNFFIILGLYLLFMVFNKKKKH